jgi:hypothetical protein
MLTDTDIQYIQYTVHTIYDKAVVEWKELDSLPKHTHHPNSSIWI